MDNWWNEYCMNQSERSVSCVISAGNMTDLLGFSGFLDKTRHLFIYEERTRIHIDEVKNGESVFYGMEFEVEDIFYIKTLIIKVLLF